MKETLEVNLRSLRKNERYTFISNYRIAKFSNSVQIKHGCSYREYKERYTLLPYQVLFYLVKVPPEERKAS